MENKEVLEQNSAQNTNSAKDWRFGVAANITRSHLDENGVIRYGTKAFVGGTKVYLAKSWNKEHPEIFPKIGVIGLNRFGRFAVEYVHISLLENVRMQKVYKPKVLEIMNYLDGYDSWEWWNRTADDRKDAEQFVEYWHNKFSQQ